MLIEDRYYVPDELGLAAEKEADRTRKMQFIAINYSGPFSSSLLYLLAARGPIGGRSWDYGPSREELQANPSCAVILWIPPSRAVA